MSKPQHPAGHVLQAFHDGELDPPFAAEVAAHCDQCETCRTELATLKEVEQLLTTAPAPELNRTVWHRVRPGLQRQPRLKPAWGLAAGVAGIVLGVLLGPVSFDSQQTTDSSTWSEAATVWNGGTSSPLLAVYQTSTD